MEGVSPTLKGLLDRKIMWSEWASEGGNGLGRPNTPKRSESDHSTEVEAEAGLQNGFKKCRKSRNMSGGFKDHGTDDADKLT